jgi:hypothetical protein
MVLVIALLATAALAAFAAYRYRTSLKAEVTKVEGGVSAFAKVAELEGKLIALKAVAEVKKAEATAVHATLDELHKLLG